MLPSNRVAAGTDGPAGRGSPATPLGGDLAALRFHCELVT